MTEPLPPDDPPATAPPLEAVTPEFRAAQRWNIVWVVPLVALLLGGWLLYRNFAAQGPTATVRFETADGISAGKTEVRCRSVKVGVVKDVKLADDLNSVRVHLEFDADAEGLLRSGTHFWVVKPRLSVTEVSGVGTLITGAYLELDPGPLDGPRQSEFIGLETPSATNRAVPGRRVVLSADEVGSLIVGSPIYFRGFEVGRIESRTLLENGMKVAFDAFINEEYRDLVTENTRFWNNSGIEINVGADGVKLRTPSLQAFIAGGVSFGVTRGTDPGKAARDGTSFTLYRDEDSARESTFNPTLQFLLLFDQTVRGLTVKAPVQFRGITIGRVADISFDLVPTASDTRIPVLIEIDPALMRPEFQRELDSPDSDYFKTSVGKGLRAALKAGNLITGALFVDLDYYVDAVPAQLGKVGGLTTLPTVSSGLAQLEAKITAILDKLQALPIEQMLADISKVAQEATTTVAEARNTLEEIEGTVASLRGTLDSPEFAGLPANLRVTLDELRKSLASVGPEGAVQGDLLRTLDELRAALRSIKAVTTTLDEKPNSLIFGRGSSGNTTPKKPRGGN